ncbi:receptor-like cytosolic serine/threonine-protein kinase RBK2 [Typha angustifolia]|uniref:receptor-like cytosolic serine/threonine-protein kinase RBK2 n=1 Tax=Typha angustifolia TaxID=59011 RepID=UPI003C2D08B4
MARCKSSICRGFLRLWTSKSMRCLSSFPLFGVLKITGGKWKGSKSCRESHVLRLDSTSESLSLKNFTLLELQNATNNFSPDNIIGRGGYAEVYKGYLADGQPVAVKKLTRGRSDEIGEKFLSELGTIVHVNHPNIVKLVGVCVEGGMHLVLELLPNGSLSTLLHGSKVKLCWDIRYKVAVGIAKGLEYLHERCPRRIIHRDIKSGNILLGEDFEPQICDFGLAKWLPEKQTHHTVSIFEGTFGYLAPEYCTHGIVNEKTDIYAFGVILLELITGRKALDYSKLSLVMWAKPFLDKNNIVELIDPCLGDAYDFRQVKCVADTARLCILHSSVLRPSISQVLKALIGEEDQPGSPIVIRKSVIRRTYSEEFFDVEEYNTTKHQSDLRRHKQLAFDF